WEGSGVMAYRVGDEVREREFGQRVAFSHDGTPHLQYSCTAWLLPDADEVAGDEVASPPSRQLFAEIGYWRLSRPLSAGDHAPGMLPATGEPVSQTADAVETLRNDRGGFDIEVLLVQPGGVSELYLGAITGPRIDLATDAVLRSATAKEYA